MTNEKIIKAYLEQDNDYKIPKSSNVFFEKNVLFSYGYHYVMAIKLKDIFLLNDLNYSVTTAKQKSIFKRLCNNYKTIEHKEIMAIYAKYSKKELETLTYNDLVKLNIIEKLK